MVDPKRHALKEAEDSEAQSRARLAELQAKLVSISEAIKVGRGGEGGRRGPRRAATVRPSMGASGKEGRGGTLGGASLPHIACSGA